MGTNYISNQHHNSKDSRGKHLCTLQSKIFGGNDEGSATIF